MAAIQLRQCSMTTCSQGKWFWPQNPHCFQHVVHALWSILRSLCERRNRQKRWSYLCQCVSSQIVNHKHLYLVDDLSIALSFRLFSKFDRFPYGLFRCLNKYCCSTVSIGCFQRWQVPWLTVGFLRSAWFSLREPLLETVSGRTPHQTPFHPTNDIWNPTFP